MITMRMAKRIGGIVLGTGIGGFLTIENENRKIMERGPSRVSPFFIPMAICNIDCS